MPIEGVNASEGARIEQRSEEVRTRQRQDDQQAEVRRVAEEGRGENMDVSV